MTDEHLKKLIEESEKLKAKNEKQETVKVTPETQKRTPPDSELWKTHKAISQRGVGILWLLPLSLTVLPLFLYVSKNISKEELILYISGLIAIPLLRYFYTKIDIILTFPEFKGWRKRLPFPLEGWENMVDAPHFGNRCFWRAKASIEILYNPVGDMDRKAVEAMLFLFCNKANKFFYEATFGYRTKWTVNGNGYSAVGSVNRDVAAQIYIFLSQTLAPVALRYKNVVKVIINTEGEEYEVPFDSVDSGGGTAS